MLIGENLAYLFPYWQETQYLVTSFFLEQWEVHVGQ